MNVIRPLALSLATAALLAGGLLFPASPALAAADNFRGHVKLDRDDDDDDGRSSRRHQCRRPASHRGWKSVRPIADAGPDQAAFAGQLVTLDGSRSRDPDGDQLRYHWEILKKPRNSRARLDGRRGVMPTLEIDRDGNYLIVLVVQSCDGVSRPDFVVVSSGGNLAPVANAGPDLRTTAGESVQLDGSSSNDPNGDSLTFDWQVVTTPPGSQAQLADTSAVRPTFTADLQGDYVLQLTVRDATMASTPDTVTVQAEPGNTAPQANAGADQSSRIGLTAALDGSASSDPDGDALTYEWNFVSQPEGSTTTLQGATSATPSFFVDVAGEYVLELRVCDGQNACSAADPVVVQAAGNTLPVAVAGESRTVDAGTMVTLDGSASSDADGDPLAFSWSLTPAAGSSAELMQPESVTPSFVADLPGEYVAQLIVNDGRANSSPATVLVVARNTAPSAANDAASTAEDTSITIDVLANDTDGNGDALSISGLIQPASGSVAVENGRVRFTPAVNFSGVTSFAYTVSDTRGGSDSANVSVTVTPVNDAPVAIADAVATAIGTPITFGVLDNDFDPDSEALEIESFSQPSSGSVALGADGQFTYTPAAGFSGTVQFSYTIADAAGATSTTTVTITVRRPQLTIEDAQILEGNSSTRTITFTVRLSEPSPVSVGFRYDTAPGTALAGTDYVTKGGLMSFSAGAVTRSVTVSVRGDTLFEGNESFFVNITEVTNADVADGQGEGVILDDD